MASNERPANRVHARDEAQSISAPHWMMAPDLTPARNRAVSNDSYQEDTAVAQPSIQSPSTSEAGGGPSSETTDRTIPLQSIVGTPVSNYIPSPHVGLPLSSTADENDIIDLSSRPNEVSDDSHGRQPLPTVTHASSQHETFEPALVVDDFLWPAECQKLLQRTAGAFEQLTGEFISGAQHGRQVVGVAGCRRGDGRKTLLLAVARELARRSTRVTLIDADLHQANLAARLGLAVQVGWEDVLGRGLPLAEAVVVSQQSDVALLPLKDVVREPGKLCEGVMPSVSIDVLRRYSDVVLVDLGPLLDDAAAASALVVAARAGIDAALLVQDANRAQIDDVSEVTKRLEIVGVPLMGVVDNFDHQSMAPPSQRTERSHLSV